MSGNVADIVDAARKDRVHQLTAGEAVHPALHGFLGAIHRFRFVLRRRCQQVGFGEGIVRIVQRVGAIQHGLELAADAVIIHRRGEHKHVGVVHFCGYLHGIVLDDAVPQLQAGKAAQAEAVILFPEMYGFHQIPGFQCALGEGRGQRLRIAALAWAGGQDQYLFIHYKTLLF